MCSDIGEAAQAREGIAQVDLPIGIDLDHSRYVIGLTCGILSYRMLSPA
jgi:hypothetical protein